MNLYFAQESGNTMKSVPFFLFAKTFSKLKLEIYILQIIVMAQFLRTTWNFVISRRCFAEDGKEMYQEL